MNGDFPQSKAILYTNDVMYSLATKGIIFLDNHRCFPFLGLVSRIPNFDSQLQPPRGPGYPVSRTIPFGWRGCFRFLLPTCLVQLVLQTERTRETRLA